MPVKKEASQLKHMPDGKVNIMVRMDPSLLERLNELARREHRSRSSQVSFIVDMYIRDHQ